METPPLRSRPIVLTALIGAAALLRLLPHPDNFVPIAAMALFSGAKLDDRRAALAVPLLAMLLSDAVIGFHPLTPFVYLCFALTVALGFGLRAQAGPLLVASGAASLLFYGVTNFALWALLDYWPHDLAGLLGCYVAGLPYLGRTFASTLLYAAALFGGLALLERRFPALALRAP
jgi:hypothetical protein